VLFRSQLFTVQHIINRWAPPVENDTGSYALAVAKHLKVGVMERINLFDLDVLTAFAQAITLHENGRPPAGEPPFWYTADDYQTAALNARKAVAGHRT
jgi:hypothetical protein